MKMKKKLTRYFGFAAKPACKMTVAVILILSASVETIQDIHKLLGTGEFAVGAHHGILVLGLMQLFRQLADLGEDVGIAAEGLIAMDDDEISEADVSNSTALRDKSS